MKQILLTILAVICLLVTILSSGVMLCMNVPAITENLSRATALTEKAKFGRDALVNMATKTQGLVSGTTSKDEVISQIEEINKEANTQYKEWTGSDFLAADEQYTLDATAMQHLEDVRVFFQNVRIAFGICGAGSVIFLALLGLLCGRSALGRSLAWAGTIIVVAMVALAAWAIADFNGMFNWLHSLFFANGSWLFSGDSLLICMYPTAFWVGMGAICIGTSFVASVIAIIVGKIIK